MLLKWLSALILTGTVVALAGCGSTPSMTAVSAPEGGALPPPTQDAATRQAPVVTGRPARVFVFAGWETNCAAVAPPDVRVITPPSKGDVTFRPGQETTIAASAGGTCAGQKTTGTGVYYTARPGTSGRDRFAVEARLASGEVSTRVFEVEIVE